MIDSTTPKSSKPERPLDDLIDDFIKKTEKKGTDKLFSALAKAQESMQEAKTDSKNPFFRSNYADFSSVVRASRKPLAAQGLAVTQIVDEDKSGRLILKTRLGPSSGQYIESKIPIGECKNKDGKPDIQAFGSRLTYLKRYTYAAIVGVVASGEDDDGEKAMDRRKSTTERISELEKVRP